MQYKKEVFRMEKKVNAESEAGAKVENPTSAPQSESVDEIPF